MKVLQLENDAIPLFRERLRGSLGLGRYMEQCVAGGSIRVWVPELSTPIDLRRLNEDIFYPASTDIASTLIDALLCELKLNPNAVLIADTAYQLKDARPASLHWFSLESFHEPELRRICAFVGGSAVTEEALEELLAVASPYPTTLVITSLLDVTALRQGAYLDRQALVLEEIVQAVKHVLIGVFDERTMLIWSSSNARSSRCMEMAAPPTG